MSVGIFRNGSYHLERTVIPIWPPCFPYQTSTILHKQFSLIDVFILVTHLIGVFISATLKLMWLLLHIWYLIFFLVNADHICMRQYHVVIRNVWLSWRISRSTVPKWPRAVTRRVPSIDIAELCEYIWLIKCYPKFYSVTKHPEAYIC